MSDRIGFGVQAEPRDLASWLALARRIEERGFRALLIGDHPAAGPAPWPALGAAAAVTKTLQLGTYVLQAGVRDPVRTAADAATLDLLAPGRVSLGLGPGHTAREWQVSDTARPSPPERAKRLVEFVDIVADLLAGELVTYAGDHLSVVQARLDDLPVKGRVELVVGGGHPAILRAAARRAEVVALSGLGRTLPDGDEHEVRWTRVELDAQLRLIQDTRSALGTSPEIEALVQIVSITDDRRQALAELSEQVPGASMEDLSSTPFLLIGTLEEMASQIRRQSEELGIYRYVVREPAVAAVEQLIPLLEIE